MSVSLSGYLALTCGSCKTTHSVESGELSFERDLSPEADDDYIRYITQLDTPCASCSAVLQVKLDVWEYPESVVNYAYYDVKGALDVECEFNIDHYFDDEATHENIAARDEFPNRERENDNEDLENETDFEDEERFKDESDSEVYKDHYDDGN